MPSPPTVMIVVIALLLLKLATIAAPLSPEEIYADIDCRDEQILPSDLLQGTGFMNAVSPPRRCPITSSQYRQLLKTAMVNRIGQRLAPIALPYPPLIPPEPIFPAPRLPFNHRHGLPVQMALPPFRPPPQRPPKPSVIEYMMLSMYLSTKLDRRRERMERIARCEAACAEMAFQDSECPPCAKA